MSQREIKFRAWDLETKRMSDPFAFTSTLYFTVEVGMNSVKKLDGHMNVMQYVELKDMNKVKIFEGDVLEHTNGEKRDMINDKWIPNTERIVVSDFGHNIWQLRSVMDSVKVIGNIYQNPELIPTKE